VTEPARPLKEEASRRPAPPPQRIPRPAAVEPGPPSPWATLPSERRSKVSLTDVRRALSSPLELSFPDAVAGAPRQSAVLAALWEEEGEARLLLTRRASTLRSHRSEVSFPGGRVEPGESLVGAALREASEEVGIDPADVEVIGELSPLMTFASAAFINPFVGLLGQRPSLRANPAEVELAFDVTIADLLAGGVHHTERWQIGAVRRDLHFFELPGDIVWGATGRMLWELLGKVTGTVPDPVPEDAPLP
jgi:8-oxo-dGTP pyrophosphatase MutT (NUDIX family)